MKKVLQVLAVLIIISCTVSAQWVTDSVTMGPGYSNNIFYGMGSGVQKTSSATDWHLAFSMNALDSASVFVNQRGNSTVFDTRVYDVARPISDWANVSYSDTLTGTLLYNGSDSWHQGALNGTPAPSVFDFGWGTYSPVTHLFTGTRLFIIETGGDFYKLAIDSMNPFDYNWFFRLESLAPSMPPTASFTVSKSNGFNDRLFAYFNIDSGVAHDREPDVNTWDLEFIGYPTYIAAGPQSAWRAVTGVLTNRGTSVAKADMIDVDDAMTAYQGWAAPWITDWENNSYTTIGYDWKTFNLGTFSYLVPDSISYFVCGKNDTVYQLQFLEFGGTQNGNIKFRHRNLGVCTPVAVNDISVFGEAVLYPNPSNNQTRLMFNASGNTNATLSIVGMNGQVIFKSVKNVTSGLNVFDINTSNISVGNYVINLQSDRGIMHKKMTVSR